MRGDGARVRPRPARGRTSRPSLVAQRVGHDPGPVGAGEDQPRRPARQRQRGPVVERRGRRRRATGRPTRGCAATAVTGQRRVEPQPDRPARGLAPQHAGQVDAGSVAPGGDRQLLEPRGRELALLGHHAQRRPAPRRRRGWPRASTRSPGLPPSPSEVRRRGRRGLRRQPVAAAGAAARARRRGRRRGRRAGRGRPPRAGPSSARSGTTCGQVEAHGAPARAR